LEEGLEERAELQKDLLPGEGKSKGLAGNVAGDSPEFVAEFSGYMGFRRFEVVFEKVWSWKDLGWKGARNFLVQRGDK
jgi:hypothetical protein